MVDIEKEGGSIFRGETTKDKHVSSMLRSMESVKHLGLTGDEELTHAARFSALRKLIIRNERQIKTQKKFPQFEYDIENIRNAKDINDTIKRLASETELAENQLMREYGNYFQDYSAKEITKRVLEELKDKD